MPVGRFLKVCCHNDAEFFCWKFRHCRLYAAGMKTDEFFYMEDLAVGQTFGAGPIAVTEAEVIAFAEKFDPQFFHIDPAAAKDSPFGGLIASGPR